MKLFKNLDIGIIVKVEIIILVILVVVGLFGFIYNYVPGAKDAITLATTVKPETFTELYFKNHLKLPSIVKIGETYSFSFTVHNLEYKTYNYPYEVYIDTNGQRQYIEKGNFSLRQDQYKTIKEDFSVAPPATRSAVVINLINKNQQIDFWIEGVK
jgi:hypothetical protein